jgi:hypothetical protein
MAPRTSYPHIPCMGFDVRGRTDSQIYCFRGLISPSRGYSGITTLCSMATKPNSIILHRRSTPPPQLFPHLNKRLHLARTRKTVVDEAAILVCPFVELPHVGWAEVCEIVTEFLEIFLAQHFCFAVVGASCHAARDSTTFSFCSPVPGASFQRAIFLSFNVKPLGAPGLATMRGCLATYSQGKQQTELKGGPFGHTENA